MEKIKAILKNEKGAMGEMLSSIGLIMLVAAVLVVLFPSLRDAAIAAGQNAVTAITGLF